MVSALIAALFATVCEMSDKRKPKQYDRLKQLKSISREEKIAGRGGFHSDKRERRQNKKSVLDYLAEVEEELKEEVEQVEEDKEEE